MIEVLAIAIGILAVLQKTDERFYAATIFSALTLAHMVLFSATDSGHAYYIGAAFLDVAIMSFIARIDKIVSLTITLHRICLVEIIVNAIGWVMWMKYADPYWYNVTFIGLHLWAIFALTRKDNANDPGGYTVGSRFDYIRLVLGKGVSHAQNREGKA